MPLSAPYDAWVKEGVQIRLPVAASVKIYKGALVQLNASGYVAPMTGAASLKFIGVAEETVDNSAGSAGAKTVLVKCERNAVVTYPLKSGETWAATDYGAAAYAEDDGTITKVATSRTQVGTLFAPDPVRTGYVWVRIVPAI